MSDKENQKQCTQKFIALANELKDQGQDPKLVSSALMMASGIYVTYVAAGNEGGSGTLRCRQGRGVLPAQSRTHPGKQESS